MRKTLVFSLLATVGKRLYSNPHTSQHRFCSLTHKPTLPQVASLINGPTLSEVRANAINISSASWEIGTLSEALLELTWPQLSIFNNAGSIPPPADLYIHDYPVDVINIATTVVNSKPDNILPLVGGDGTAVGDPASIGPAVLLANWTRNDTSDNRFSIDAGSELNYLLNSAPRTSDGAISHRPDQVQLWADFIYMAPPFIAYFGACDQPSAENYLLQVAYDQCRLYRQYLQDNTTKLWRHIALGTYNDTNLWGTGNGWAAAGMMRVLQTMSLSNASSNFTSQQNNLTNWVEEIVKGSWQHQTTSGALRNIINDPSTFEDSSSTALIASVTYRLAVVKGDNTTYIANANAAYNFVSSSIDNNGWLRNTVDPYTFYTLSDLDTPSPEGQSFVLLLESARRDYQDWVQANATLPSGGMVVNNDAYQ